MSYARTDQDKLHNAEVFKRFSEILAKVSPTHLCISYLSQSQKETLADCPYAYLYCDFQARGNKTASKFDSDLKEFEDVSCPLDVIRSRL